jgi:hypothetical protein
VFFGEAVVVGMLSLESWGMGGIYITIILVMTSVRETVYANFKHHNMRYVASSDGKASNFLR